VLADGRQRHALVFELDDRRRGGPLKAAADQRRQFVGELWRVAEAERLRRDTQAGRFSEILDENGERRPVRRWHSVRLATSRARAVEPGEPAMATAAGTAP
jgi:hypothetical protein